MEKLGIEDLKLAVKFGAEFGMATEKSLADGKLGIEDASHFLPVFMNNAQNFASFKNVPKQIADIDAAEMAELCEYGKNVLNLEDDKLEQKIEACLQAAVVLFNLVEIFKKPVA